MSAGVEAGLIITVLALYVAGMVVIGMKHRWGWLAAGALLGPFAVIIGVFLPARAGSPWAARRSSVR